jgi:hypothetical protein
MNNKQNLDGTANQDSRANENQPTEPTSSRNHVNQEQTNQDTYNYSTNNNMDTEQRQNITEKITHYKKQQTPTKQRIIEEDTTITIMAPAITITATTDIKSTEQSAYNNYSHNMILLQTKLMKHGERAYINYHLQLLGSTSRILMDSNFDHISLSGRHTSSL